MCGDGLVAENENSEERHVADGAGKTYCVNALGACMKKRGTHSFFCSFCTAEKITEPAVQVGVVAWARLPKPFCVWRTCSL